MTDKIDLTLEHLKVLRAESKQNREDVRDITHHVIAMRNQMADFLKEHAYTYERLAEHDARLETIEKRLGLIDEDKH
jgi:hypothetical protein